MRERWPVSGERLRPRRPALTADVTRSWLCRHGETSFPKGNRQAPLARRPPSRRTRRRRSPCRRSRQGGRPACGVFASVPASSIADHEPSWALAHELSRQTNRIHRPVFRIAGSGSTSVSTEHEWSSHAGNLPQPRQPRQGDLDVRGRPGATLSRGDRGSTGEPMTAAAERRPRSGVFFLYVQSAVAASDAGQTHSVRRSDVAGRRPPGARPDDAFPGTCRRGVPRHPEEIRTSDRAQDRASTQRRSGYKGTRRRLIPKGAPGGPLTPADRIRERASNRDVDSLFCGPFRVCWKRSMAPRANWKGYLRLSLVSCPVAPSHHGGWVFALA